ncbi:PepSY domain-containing protein [Candidatus Allofournierella merdipullorum]|uniref:PepSY domain-containing protein n=1 Tax=Candidatus Allofournierella merdipullorum TaxID=2838595 RepID=UPI002A87D247|nr:PepSY domain-containing protein [Candidatus Fournierella merdipullorum]
MKKLIAAALAALTIALFTACANAGQLAYIGDEAARAAALSGAGLSADAVTFTGTELTRRDGVEYYVVSFTSGDSRYESQVDALSGVVIQSETAPLSQSASSASGASITAEDAKAKALAHAGLAAADVTFIKAELDRDDGRLVYDVEFYTADNKEYDYEIDAATGDVVNFDYDVEHYAPPAASGNQSGAASAASLTAEDAKAKALAHAGLAAADVTFVKAELDRDDGRLVYDVEFYTADYKEYDYEIDAATGDVVSYDYDAESYAPPAASGTISAEDAKALALAQVPGAAASDIREFETDRDDGRVEYEGKIVYGGMEYEFEIDGYSGAIRSWEAEPLH